MWPWRKSSCQKFFIRRRAELKRAGDEDGGGVKLHHRKIRINHRGLASRVRQLPWRRAHTNFLIIKPPISRTADHKYSRPLSSSRRRRSSAQKRDGAVERLKYFCARGQGRDNLCGWTDRWRLFFCRQERRTGGRREKKPPRAPSGTCVKCESA